MTHLRIHLIYLAIIGVLAYQYWTKTEALDNAVQSIEQMDKLLKINNDIVDSTLRLFYKEIEKEASGYPSSMDLMFLKLSKNAIVTAKPLIDWLESEKLKFINLSGGVDKTDSTVLANRLSTKPSTLLFSSQEIQEMRHHLTNFQGCINAVRDTFGIRKLQKQYLTLNLLENEAYWQRLKNCSAADALMQLTMIQNRIVLDKITYFRYIYNSFVGNILICGPTFRVAIAPYKAFLLEGETFKADIYLAQYAVNPISEVTFIVNNQGLAINQGVAHFETTETKVGKRFVKATARIRNPLTGNIYTTNGEFEYEVLPKCSKNCQ